jgi:deoxyribodipyrimidine photo-lyase
MRFFSFFALRVGGGRPTVCVRRSLALLYLFPKLAAKHGRLFCTEDVVTAPVLVWFREDLRVSDNPALSTAVETQRPVLCFYIVDEATGAAIRGGASRWWLHGSLAVLAEQLERRGSALRIFKGSSAEIVPHIVRETGAAELLWNRRYGPEREIDAALKASLRENGVAVRSFASRLLYEPGEVLNKTGGIYKVFTPYRNATLIKDPPPRPLAAPDVIEAGTWPPQLAEATSNLEDLNLEPTRPDWAGGLRETWKRGEAGAQERLFAFLEHGFAGYAETRDRPDLDATSRLSPSLHFGEITPRQIVHTARHGLDSGEVGATERDYDVLRSELGWRDFSHQLLFFQEDISRINIQRNFDGFPWREDEAALRAWQRGRTGYPFVDAGMRELWQTGFMHNRVRMVVASFLIKHLLIDWRVGEAWFRDTLVDADPANNAASWQWVAGSGADASPYYRIFNPISQGERFDPKGDYVRRWVPELEKLPRTAIHRPWEASSSMLEFAGVRLGIDYPLPVVGHEEGRKRALAAFESISLRAS